MPICLRQIEHIYRPQTITKTNTTILNTNGDFFGTFNMKLSFEKKQISSAMVLRKLKRIVKEKEKALSSSNSSFTFHSPTSSTVLDPLIPITQKTSKTKN
uniref:Uncharacterized protein n=1 Tax=Rhizophora mucronata TaxID=61149 RepID=A0A2P2IMK3_RHIMU